MNRVVKLILISALSYSFTFVAACTLLNVQLPALPKPVAAKLEPSLEPAVTQPAEPDKAASLMTDAESNTVYGAVLAVLGVGVAVGIRYLTKPKSKQ